MLSTMNLEKIAQSNLIDTLKLKDAPQEVRQEAVDEALEIIFESVVDRIKAEFSNEVMTQYMRVFEEENSEEKRVEFLKTHVPNFEEIVAEETFRYKYLTEIMVSALRE